MKFAEALDADGTSFALADLVLVPLGGVGGSGDLGGGGGTWQQCNLVFLSPAYLSGGSMARRPRSSRAWHFVLSGVRREADGWAGARGWGYDSDGQVGWARGALGATGDR